MKCDQQLQQDTQQPLLVRPAPQDGEAWGGYLRRLACVNGYAGVQDLAALAKTTSSRILVSEPLEILSRLGFSKSNSAPSSEQNLNRKRVPVELTVYRYCPICLAEDETPYIRSEWQSPISLACSHHGTALVGRCSICNEKPRFTAETNFYRSSHDLNNTSTFSNLHIRCSCGAVHTDESVKLIPPEYQLLRVILEEAYRSISKNTFAKTTTVEQHACAMVNWLLQPVDVKTGRRKPKTTRALGILSLDSVRAMAPYLVDWPQRAKTLVYSEYQRNATNRSGFLKRRLRVDSFVAMNDLVKALECEYLAEQLLWKEENNRLLVDRNRDNFGLDELSNLTGINYVDLYRLCKNGIIPNAQKRSRKKCRYQGTDVPAAVYRSIARAYQETNSIEVAAMQVGCEPDIVKSLIKAGCVPSFYLVKRVWSYRIKPVDMAEFAQKLFNKAKTNHRVTEADCVPFSKWVGDAYSDTTAVKWKRLMAAVERGALTVYSKHQNPVQLDELFILKEDFSKSHYKRNFQSKNAVV
jgi:hypothetical protein